MKNLIVTPINNSQLLSISYDSTNPQLAADITNSIANTFVQQNLERRFDTASSYKEYVSENIKVTKKSLDDAERRLNEYAKNNNSECILADSVLRPESWYMHTVQNVELIEPFNKKIFKTDDLQIISQHTKKPGKLTDAERIAEVTKKEKHCSLQTVIF